MGKQDWANPKLGLNINPKSDLNKKNRRKENLDDSLAAILILYRGEMIYRSALIGLWRKSS
jgi:hypothetical protein